MSLRRAVLNKLRIIHETLAKPHGAKILYELYLFKL